MAVVRLLAGMALAWAAAPVWAADTLPSQQVVRQGGVQAVLRLSGAAEGPAVSNRPIDLALTLTDDATSTPLRGLRPRMWMSRESEDERDTMATQTRDTERCATQVRRFASGKLAQRADRDLNSFQLLTLNADATVSVINPLLQLRNTKLEALIKLPAVGTDWVHAQGLDRLFITLPERGALAVIDLGTNRLTRTIELGEGQPRRLVLSPDERTVWVAMDGTERLLAVDTDTLAPRAELAVGSGRHALAISDDGARVVVSSDQARRVSVIDARLDRLLASLELPDAPHSLSLSALARRAYVGSEAAASVSVIDFDSARLLPPIAVPQPVDALRVDPSGRHLLAVHRASSTLMAIDTTRDRLVTQARTVAEPDQIGYSARFAFVRGLGSLSLQMVELRALDEGRLSLSELPVFQKPPGRMPEHTGAGDLIVSTPEPGSILIGNPPDNALYYYTEGMMAPQGSYATYSRAVRAVRVVDRSLKETAPGVYTGRVRLDQGGRYSLPLLLEQPRLVQCFALTVDDVGGRTESPRPDVRFNWTRDTAIRTGAENELQIRLLAAGTGTPISGVRDLQLMALERPGLSQQRLTATEREPGLYVVRLRFPRAGVWRLMVQSRSQRLTLDRSAWIDLPVRNADDPVPAAPAEAIAPRAADALSDARSQAPSDAASTPP